MTLDLRRPFIAQTVGLGIEAKYISSALAADDAPSSRALLAKQAKARTWQELNEVRLGCSVANWDGFGASPVAWTTFSHAWEFVDALPQGFPMPTPGAEPDGHITLEWYKSPRQIISVSMDPERQINFAAIWPEGKRKKGAMRFNEDAPLDLLDLIHTVLSA